MRNIDCAFFDLDHTILKINSGAALVKNAYRTGLLSRRKMIKAIYLAALHKLNLRQTSEIISEMPGWLKGISEKNIIQLSQFTFKENLLSALRPEIYKEVEVLRSEGIKLVILSAAMNYVCEPVADHLRFDDIICSKLEVTNGVFTGYPDGRLCFKDEKLLRMQRYCSENKIDPKRMVYYADALSDLPVFNAVGLQVCVNPGKALKKIALKKEWVIKIYQ